MLVSIDIGMFDNVYVMYIELPLIILIHFVDILILNSAIDIF